MLLPESLCYYPLAEVGAGGGLDWYLLWSFLLEGLVQTRLIQVHGGITLLYILIAMFMGRDGIHIIPRECSNN